MRKVIAKIIRNIVSLILLVIVMLTLTNERMSRWIDDVILLENRNPGYYDYLSKSCVYYVSKDALNEYNDNLLTNGMQTKNYIENGFEILVHEDGSFTFSGTYTGKDLCFIYPMEIGYLKSGDYIISDGGASIENGIQMRIFGVKKLPDGSTEYGDCIELPSEGLFHWDSNKYDKAVSDVVIYPGFSAEKLRFYPMLRDSSKGKILYQNAIRKLSSLSNDQNRNDYEVYLKIKLDKQAVDKLDGDDWHILYNEAKYQKQVDWISIDFGDGTGIQICDDVPNNMIYGVIDTIGRVRNKQSY